MAGIAIVTEDVPSGVLETRLYEDGYGTITVLDNFGFEVKQFEARIHPSETTEMFHDRLADILKEAADW